MNIEPFLDELLQRTISQEELSILKRKQALITPLNRRICIGLGFTKAAAIANAIFPDEALKFAANSCDRTTEGELKYAEFNAIAFTYCNDHGIKVDLTLHSKLITLFKVPKNSKMVKINYEPLLPYPQSSPKKPTKPLQPSKSSSKKVVYDKPTSTDRVLTSSDIHLLKYGNREIKKERAASWQPKPKRIQREP